MITLLLLIGVLAPKPAHAADFTVNSTDDDPAAGPTNNGVCATATAGECTLRAAIQEANGTSGVDTINFNIPGKTIEVGSTGNGELPQITGPVIIDGYTQPGAKPNTKTVGNDAKLKIELNGTNAGADADGLDIRASNSTIKGLVINRFKFGVVIAGTGGSTTNVKVEGNYIGTSAKGTKALGNADGVGISSNNNTVGGTEPGAGNVISGNTDDGVFISGGEGNNVEGNFIGTKANGTKALGNGGDGVHLLGVSNTVGGTAGGARNVISGNGGRGVFLDTGAQFNEVLGNRIGTDENGTKALANTGAGVLISRAPDNTIGGTASGAGNVISGNGEDGIFIFGSQATGNTVEHNEISGNTGDGVFIGSASNNTIGGTASGAGNLIFANGDDGVEISEFSDSGEPTGNSVLSTRILSNGDLGIDLGTSGVTDNDPDDPDLGANNQQNFPDITEAKRNSTTGVTTIKGTLNSNPNEDFLIQCFETDDDPSQTHGEGKRLLDFDVVSTNPAGDSETFICDDTELAAGATVSATATKTNGPDTLDTSEFSENETVV